MLILTRRIGETLRIGSNVSVTVLGMRGRQVRIGITAPKSVTVHREELYERLRSGQGQYKSTRQPTALLGRT
jgi:carbon storage regulator